MATRNYHGIMRGKFIYDGCKTLDEMVDSLVEEINLIRQMRDKGVTLASEVDKDCAELVTENADTAKEFSFTLHEEEG